MAELDESTAPPEPETNAEIARAIAGCVVGVILVGIVLVGLPVGIYRAVTTGDWTIAVAALIAGGIFAIGSKLGWIESLND